VCLESIRIIPVGLTFWVLFSNLSGARLRKASMSAALEKFRKKQMHKWRKPIGLLADMLNPIIIVNSGMPIRIISGINLIKGS
jgi:hypothetical protein